MSKQKVKSYLRCKHKTKVKEHESCNTNKCWTVKEYKVCKSPKIRVKSYIRRIKINHKVYDVDISYKQGDSDLIKAVINKDVESVKELVKYEDVNAVNDNNQTAIHHAIILEEPEIVAILQDSGANMNIKDNSGNTPKVLLDSNPFMKSKCLRSYRILKSFTTIDCGKNCNYELYKNQTFDTPELTEAYNDVVNNRCMHEFNLDDEDTQHMVKKSKNKRKRMKKMIFMKE